MVGSGSVIGNESDLDPYFNRRSVPEDEEANWCGGANLGEPKGYV